MDETTDGPTDERGVEGQESSETQIGEPADDHDVDIDPDSDAGSLIVRERQTDEGLLVALCDDDVLGETFEEGAVSLTVTEEFYAGDAVDAETAVESLSRAAVANIVGTRAVEVAVDAGIIDEAHVLEVESTLHAQLVRFS